MSSGLSPKLFHFWSSQNIRISSYEVNFQLVQPIQGPIRFAGCEKAAATKTCLYIWHSNALPFGIQHCSTNLRCHGIFSLSSAVGRRLVYALWVRERSWCVVKKALIPKATSASLDIITDALTSRDNSNCEKKWKHSTVPWYLETRHNNIISVALANLRCTHYASRPIPSEAPLFYSTLLAGAGSACPCRIALQLHAATHSSEALEPWGGNWGGSISPQTRADFECLAWGRTTTLSSIHFKYFSLAWMGCHSHSKPPNSTSTCSSQRYSRGWFWRPRIANSCL